LYEGIQSHTNWDCIQLFIYWSAFIVYSNSSCIWLFKKRRFFSATSLFIAIIDIVGVLFIIANFYVDVGFSNKESSLGFQYIFGDTWKLIAIVVYFVIGLASLGIIRNSLLKINGLKY